jgi:hypothetical protein
MKKFTLLLLVAISICSYGQIPTNGLVAYYPFNGNANDESGNGNNGTVNGAIADTDRFGNINAAYRFDGNSGTERYIQSNIGQHDTLSFTGWIKAPYPTTHYPSIFCYGTANRLDLGMEGNHPTYIANGLVGKIAAGAVIGGGWSGSVNSNTYVTDNVWHFFAVSYVPSDSIYLYVDNKLIGTSAYAPNYPTDDLLFIGRGIYDSPANEPHQSHFNGTIDDLRIYSRKLYKSEIANVFNEGKCVETVHDTVHVTVYDTLKPVSNEGLVAYYPFNGNSLDKSGNNNNGTVNGATLCPDRLGNANSAYSFNGSSDYIIIPDHQSLRPDTSISLCAWVWIDSTQASNYTRILSKWVNINDSYGSYQLIAGYLSSIGYGGMTLQTTSSYNWVAPNPIFPLEQWAYIVGTWDGSKMRLYCNGEKVGEKDQTGTINYDDNPLLIGKDGVYADACFKGSIDEVKIYKRSLSGNEVRSLYKEQNIVVFDTVNVYDTIPVYEKIAVTDTLIINAVLTGIEPPENINTIKIYPNPAKDYLFINTGNYIDMPNYSLKIVNQIGVTVFETTVEQPLYEINLSTWSGKGIYFVNLYNSNYELIEVKKIILQ